MAYEILNNGQVTPHRLHALVRLIARLPEPSRQQIQDLLQPSVLVKNQSASEEVYRAALQCGLIKEDAERGGRVTLATAADLETSEAFRRHMQRILTGVIDESRPNHLMNLFAAWYAVQNERVFQLDAQNLTDHFNDEVFPGTRERAFNTTKLPGWSTWAAYVGWGWYAKSARVLSSGNVRRAEMLLPDATFRIATLLPQLLPDEARAIGFRIFAERLALQCPEMDGGALFERCWDASRRNEGRGNRLSLMLSTALRTLHSGGQIELIRQADAGEIWHLYPAEGAEIRQITHIRQGDH